MMSKSYWHYFECLDADCSKKEQIVVDVRTNNTIVFDPHLPCPICKKPMVYGGQEEADADGYRPQRFHGLIE